MAPWVRPGTDTNPFSLDALAVFLFPVLQRVNNLSHKEFEGELVEQFASLVKMPLLKSDSSPLPDPVKSISEERLNLNKPHTRHGSWLKTIPRLRLSCRPRF